MKIYDQSNIPDSVFEKMKELKEIEDKLQSLQPLIDQRNSLMDEIENDFPQDGKAMASKDGLVLYWKKGKRQIGKVNLEALETIDNFLVRVIPEKLIPAEKKPQTLTNIERWMDELSMNEVERQRVYALLNIKQSKKLVVEMTEW